MRFQLDHDWQGNMSTPRARVGDSIKTQLLLVLCAIWILVGLTGHAPWKHLEATSISIVKSILDGGSMIAPLASGSVSLETPPLYYLSAALGANMLAPLMDIHDGARFMNVLWLSIILLMVGMTGRELWSRGVGRHATFIMIGTIGLVISAHSLTAEVASLASTATGFYALALSKRRPWRASGLFGAALVVGFLSYGFMPILILISTALVLPILFKSWRTQSFMKFLTVSILIASPFIIVWLGMLHYYNPLIYSHWWDKNLNRFHHTNLLYFFRILIWYAWPALPLALLGLWRYRQQLFKKPKFQLILVFFTCTIVLLGIGAPAKDIHALPLLLPLVAMGAGAVEHLKRGMAAALNWFGIMLFGLIGSLIWLGWVAITIGYPAKIKERIVFLSGLNHLDFNWLFFLIALIVSIIWIFVCIRAKQTNKSTVSNWAIGMTVSWSLLMTLWLPLLDSAKSYQSVFSSLNSALQKKYTCINSLNVERQQRLLLNYYTDIKVQPLQVASQPNCDLYLILDTKGTDKAHPGQNWKKIWTGKRPADRRESFRLFKRIH